MKRPFNVATLPTRRPTPEETAASNAVWNRLGRILWICAIGASKGSDEVRECAFRFAFYSRLAFEGESNGASDDDIRCLAQTLAKREPHEINSVLVNLDPAVLKAAQTALMLAGFMSGQSDDPEVARLLHALLHAAARAEPVLAPFVEAEVGS
jgi:hypothetical protein